MSKNLRNILAVFLILLFLWSTLVMVEYSRLEGSTDPGERPFLTLGSTQIQNELAEYHSLGFTQRYELTEGDQVVSGEFRILGIKIASWSQMVP